MDRPQILMIVRFRTKVPADELERRYRERMPQFRSLPGLVQKYYVHRPDADEWGGVYLWASEAAMQAYLESDLRRSIATAYEVEGAPQIDILPVVELLR